MAGAHLDSVPDPPASTTTAPAAPRCSRSPCRWPGQADEQGPLRLVGRRGVQPHRLDVLRQQPDRGAAGRDQAVPQLRHDRARPTTCSASTTATTPRPRAPAPARPARRRSRRCSRPSSPAAACPPTAADFTGRSDYGPFIAAGSASRPVACSPAPRAEDRRRRGQVGRRGGRAVRPVLPRGVRQPLAGADGADAALYARTRRAQYPLFGNINRSRSTSTPTRSPPR